MLGISRAASDVMSLQAAQELLSAVETLKGRLNKAFSERVIDKVFYQAIRIHTQSLETSVREFALHHERSYNRTSGFVERLHQQNKGMLSR